MFINNELSHYNYHVSRWKTKYTNEIEKCLKALDPCFEIKFTQVPSNVIFGLLQHTFYICSEVLSTKDYDLAERALSIWDLDEEIIIQSLNRYKGISRLILERENCIQDSKIDKKFETGCYIIGPEALTNKSPSLNDNYLNTCWTLIESSGLSFLVDKATSVIINLQYRDMDESMTGYTLRPLQETVYTDWTDSPLRYAESIVHEAAHSWLNQYLASFGLKSINTERKYWSPWRGIDRPALGIIHGVWAFSIVYTFYKNLLSSESTKQILDQRQLKYCKDRVEFEFYRLQEVKDSLEDVFSHLDNSIITEMIMSYYPENLEC